MIFSDFYNHNHTVLWRRPLYGGSKLLWFETRRMNPQDLPPQENKSILQNLLRAKDLGNKCSLECSTYFFSKEKLLFPKTACLMYAIITKFMSVLEVNVGYSK